MNATTTKPIDNRKASTLIRKVGIYRILQGVASFIVRDHAGKFCLRAGTLQQCFNFINCKRG